MHDLAKPCAIALSAWQQNDVGSRPDPRFSLLHNSPSLLAFHMALKTLYQPVRFERRQNQPPLLGQSQQRSHGSLPQSHTAHVSNNKNQTAKVSKVTGSKERGSFTGIPRIAPSSSDKYAWYSREAGWGRRLPVVLSCRRLCNHTHNDSTSASTWHIRHS